MRERNYLSIALIAAIGILSVSIFSEAAYAQIKGSRELKTPIDTRTATVSSDLYGIRYFDWQTVVNNRFAIPGTEKAEFSSYGQPSVNSKGMVVFRARSTAGEHFSGIFMRPNMFRPVMVIADPQTLVPYPNNLNTKFREFSAFPRIAMNTDLITMTGLHQPVYKYSLPKGGEVAVGTTGIYVQFGTDLLVTAASKLGSVPGFDYYSVPSLKSVAFDVFPGAAAIADDGTVVFKGNYSLNGVSKTGVFVREVLNTPGGGVSTVAMIANSDMDMPAIPMNMDFPTIKFDSTAPPTVAGDQAIFLGLDNEEAPTAGGIYLAQLKGETKLQNIVPIGEPLPGVHLPPLTRIGEALAFDGRYVTFWAAWGKDTKAFRLYCPADGNRSIITYCNGSDPNSVFDKETGRWFQDKEVPLNQGIFIYDLLADTAYRVADNQEDFDDFLFWVYSGKAPGADKDADADAEPPRWRSSAFVAASNGWVVFKARNGDPSGEKESVDGLYMSNPVVGDKTKVIAETGMDGGFLDPGMSSYFRETLPITGLGIERDGFRGNMLAITATMGNDEFSWGGIYLANVGDDRVGKTVSKPKTVK